ncbi:MAG TPA: regulatory protein RecX [Alphaproteobacteria bacterium]|nr:regulatory protein RecX [Alphaproteobacteria bacterium]
MTLPHEDKAAAPKNKPPKERKIKVPKKISARYLYNSGLAYLQRFPASTHHFRGVMMRKIQKSCRHHTDQNMEECQKLLEETISQFKELGLLDDAAYLKGMVTSFRRRGLSSTQIGLKLQQKGYDSAAVKNELQKYDRDEFQSEANGDYHAALIFARKKRLGPFDTDNRKTPEKSLAAMARAGYSFDVAKKILNISLEEVENGF